MTAQLGGYVDISGPWGSCRSLDHGNTFSRGFDLFNACEWVHGIAANPLEPESVFIATARGLFEIRQGFRPHQPGDTISFTTVFPASQYHTSSPRRASWVGTNRSRDNQPNHFDIYFSDGFQSWRQTCGNGGDLPRCSPGRWVCLATDHADHNGIAFNPLNNSAQFLVTDGGVHRPTDADTPNDCGENWQITGGTHGFSALQIYEVAGQIISGRATTPAHTDLYIGTQDNSFFASSDNGEHWPVKIGNEGSGIQLMRTSDFECLSLPPSCPPTVTWFQAFYGNRYSRPHFADAASLAWGNPPGPMIDNPTIIAPGFYMQLSQASSLDLIVNLTGPGGVGGGVNSWRNVVTIPRVERLFGPQVSILRNDVTIYQPVVRPTGRAGLVKIRGIHRDGTVESVRVEDADGTGLNSIGIAGDQFDFHAVYAVDPNDPNHLYAADVGTSNMVFSTNGGAEWTTDTALTYLVKGYLPVSDSFEFLFNAASAFNQIQARAIAFDPFHHNHILVGTQAGGIFRSIDGGASWAPVPNSRQITRVTSFFFEENSSGNPNDEVIVSSYGRGLWKLVLPHGAWGSSRPFRLSEAPFVNFSSWLRSPTTAQTNWAGRDILVAPVPCPACRWVAIPGGTIKDIIFDQANRVSTIAIDGGDLAASSAEGQPLVLDIPTAKTNKFGKFDGCSGCGVIVSQGGVIKGLVLEDGMLKAIIAGEGSLPGEAEIDAFSPPPVPPPVAPEVTRPAGPYLFLTGTVPVGAQATAFSGDTITVEGSGFCGGAPCSTINLSIGDRVAVTNVPVDIKGNFQAVLTITEPTGVWEIRASQLDASGRATQAASTLVVPVSGDEDEGQEIEPPELESAGSLDGKRVGVCFNGTITQESAEDATHYSVNNGVIQVLSATLRPEKR